MHKNDAQRAPLRLPRFDSLTGRRRRGWAALAGAIALALFLGSGIAVAAVSSAEAHDVAPLASCSAITVDAKSYNDSKGPINTIVAVVDGVTQPTVYFGSNAKPVFAFADSTSVHSYSVTITAWDDADGKKGWTQAWPTASSTPCAPPLISASASACTVVGSTSVLTAEVSKLVAGRDYSVELLKNGTSVDSFTINSAQTVWPNAGSPLPASWSTLEAGATYTIKVTDSTDSSLFASADAVSLACPVSPNLNLAVTECTVSGGSGQVVVTAAVVAGRTYLVQVFKDGAVFDTFTGAASSAVFTRTYAAAPLSTWYFTVKDVAANVTDQTAPSTLLPCPGVPVKPVLSLSQCTATTGTANGTLGISAGGLVPGRTYAITVSDGSSIVYTAPATGLAPASSSTWTPASSLVLPPGTYTVTVTDVSDPAVTTLVAAETATLVVCPRQQEVAVSATECTVPGGTGTIDASVTDYAPGRTYTITLTQNGVAVGSSQDFTPTDPAEPAVPFTFSGLTAGQAYRVIVVDKASSSVITAGDIVLADCPGNPEAVLTQGTCSILTGSSIIKVDLARLVAGQTYTVGISATGIPAQQVTATAATASISFTGIPNGKPYTITVENAAKTLTATSTITPKICDLPTFDLPIDLPTLAYTGSSTTLPVLLAVGLFQLGLVLLGISLLRRRGGARRA